VKLLLAALVLYGVLVFCVWLFADRMIFLPPRASYTAQNLATMRIPTTDGQFLAAHYLPNDEADFVILYSHGNAEDLGSVTYTLQELHAHGFAVLGYDYRGYGLSHPGRPTAARARGDLVAAYDYAVNQLGISADRIVLYGRSVGSGPTMQLAAEQPVAGLILESPFISIYRVVTNVPVFPFDKFPNLRLMKRVRCPVLIIHGTRDEVIPVAHGRRLYAAAREPKQALWVEGAGHNDVAAVAGSRYGQALQSFQALLRAQKRL
jgi:abhydrolase domain-containing protein 17